MGVHGLWDLLAPVGRRVSVETLAGKRLAIDASIWMVQFMKAMRDEKGEMVLNAHLLGFFRRICKLLFLRTRPVFVFDGATPALKRRTLAARRRHRDAARAKIRKTAEKLLLNHLKAKRLEELAAEIKSTQQKGKGNDDLKGKKILDEDEAKQEVLVPVRRDAMEGCSDGGGVRKGGSSNQEILDELLAASLAAEEERDLNMISGSALGQEEEEDDDKDNENEEMILIGSSNVDPAVLASLPPSMQLDLLVQMRERVMAENRQKYQKIKKAPAKFSELQIQSYLKTVAFRREIDEVQKTAAGRGLGGVQTSRIASEANREFIFSSSFTGDKQMLTNGAVAKRQEEPTILNLPCRVALSSQPNSAKDVSVDGHKKDFGPDVETYFDAQGRLRVSRLRGLGIRMTRDLQRNLDIMKEYEQENTRGVQSSDVEASFSKEIPDVLVTVSENGPESVSILDRGNQSVRKESLTSEGSDNFNVLSITGRKDLMQISFSEDECRINDADDEVFLKLVSGSSSAKAFEESIHSDKISYNSESDCMWEEGQINNLTGSARELAEEISEHMKSGNKEENVALANKVYENEVDWEEGECYVSHGASNRQDEPDKVPLHGMLEENQFASPNKGGNDEVEWEEGVCHDSHETFVRRDFNEHEKIVSLGSLEEEAELQEAIRRSLEDINEQKCRTPVHDNLILETSLRASSTLHDFADVRTPAMPLENSLQRMQSRLLGELDKTCSKDAQPTPDSPKNHLDICTSDIKPSMTEELIEEKSSICPTNILLDEPVNDKLDGSLKSPETIIVQSNNYHQSSVPTASLGKIYDGIFPEIQSSLEEMVGNISAVEFPSAGKEKLSTSEKANESLESFGEKYSTQEMEVSEVDLQNEISLLREERAELGNDQKKQERNAESVSSEMFTECQELLQMFGLPYIISPMEAEAQCAFMEMANLVDGVVTDDSDVFLFGARSVYKNIFDDRKYVETYFVKDIENELGLDREKLIRTALLLGSDYTEGVSGVGIVNAIEILQAFPEEDGLKIFREWIESPDPALLGKIDPNIGGNSKKISTKINTHDVDGTRKNVEGDTSKETFTTDSNEEPTASADIKYAFMSKHRNMSKNWHIPSSFPSELVISAYTSPQVDKSIEPFSWGKPDLFLLQKLCWDRFGWTNQKSNELLLPVLKEYNKHETQLRLEAFYTFNERFAKVRSQRIKKALKGMTGKLSADMTDPVGDGPASGKNKKIDTSVMEKLEPESSIAKSERGKEVTNKSRKRKAQGKFMHSEDTVSGYNRGDKTERGRGRGRGRGNGTRRASGQVKPRKGSSYESSNNDSDSTSLEENIKQAPEGTPKLRRSLRQQKQASYVEQDLDFKDSNNSMNQINIENIQGNATVNEPGAEDSKGKVGFMILDGDDSSREHLSSGGGFCVDEIDSRGDASQLASSSTMQNSVDPSNMDFFSEAGAAFDDPGDGSSIDYLNNGGGFCLDEGAQDNVVEPSSARLSEDLETWKLSSNKSQNAHNIDSLITGQDNVTIEAEEENPLPKEKVGAPRSIAAKGGLSAMPSLRKRRKP